MDIQDMIEQGMSVDPSRIFEGPRSYGDQDPLPVYDAVESEPPVHRKENPNYAQRFAYKDWVSLLDSLKGAPGFKIKVRSSPGDDMRFVFVVDSVSELIFENGKVTFTVTDHKINVDVENIKGDLTTTFVKCLFVSELRHMPLYLNDQFELIQRVAKWRLDNAL